VARVRITFDGLEEAIELLEGIDARAADLRPVLAASGQDMVTAFQENIRSEGSRLADRGVVWPELHPATRAIRRHYGHGEGPRLVRSGDLLLSIGVLDLADTYVEVGSTHHAARVVHAGGTVTDPKSGRRRTVQAFPWAMPSVQDVDDWTALFADYVAGGNEGVA
jgi:hypothetical protein